MSDTVRSALEAARCDLTDFNNLNAFEDGKPTEIFRLCPLNTLQKINDALEAYANECAVVEKKDAFSARYLQQMLMGFEKGKITTEQRYINTQPYEITTDVGVKYSAKGECQPEASVKITRWLEDGNQISELIKADLSRGVEETMAAVAEIMKRGGKA